MIPRKFHPEAGYPVLAGLQGEAAVVGSQHLADEDEAESLAVWLGCEEWGKKLCCGFGQYGCPVVGDVKNREVGGSLV